ncbi:3-keto-5-aminohexanoate cleavage protein [Streptomyces griseorubiginosus]|uniref:3-keto-5-aminohexanoate cleavage protein n=1 Tax=Streptomyces griseorubiginosus TaxID=67304 RepID=UPI001AD69C15|nr:3-keto-5-aminohexanoate cleavage protein [Streptomyces griseorubiginosus]MBO4254085.1 3-keto-5-aminohexanoate cleavage protein [Streptomyces griseorubiginosus]
MATVPTRRKTWGTNPDNAVIVEVAINGGRPKAANPRVPRTPEEISLDTLACLEAGASIVHNHNDDPNFGGTGRHDAEPYLAAWRPVLAQRPDAILYPTMEGGGTHTTIKTRTAHLEELAAAGVLKMAIVDMGTTNMGGLDERGVPTASDDLFINTNGDAHYMFDLCRRHQLGPSIGIIEPGSIRVLLAFWRNGLLPQGAMVRLMFGGENALCGLPPTPAALDLYLELLEPTGLPWSVAIIGGNPLDLPLAAYALERGGHLRIGLEDNPTPTGSNSTLVQQALDLINTTSRPLATTAVTKTVLGLPETR